MASDGVLNLGTCGGVAKNVRKGDIILANRTLQYDVLQRFGEPSLRFKRGLETHLDTSWADLGKDSETIHIGTIASADQDLDYENRKLLQRKGVLAADWESASIAEICMLNKTSCLVLRGISDIPETKKESGEDLQELDLNKNTRIIMEELLSIIGQIVFCRNIYPRLQY
jgi:adenosylhomocysteine nucleosidase